MAVFWRSGLVLNTGGINGSEVPIVQLGLAERLRRIIMRWQIIVQPVDAAIRSDIYQNGIISLVQATSGSPPAFPDPIANGFFDDRDIIYSDWQTMGPAATVTGLNPVPADGRSGEMDTDVSRGDGITPYQIWWVWGVGPLHTTSVNVCFDRLWFRALIEQV